MQNTITNIQNNLKYMPRYPPLGPQTAPRHHNTRVPPHAFVPVTPTSCPPRGKYYPDAWQFFAFFSPPGSIFLFVLFSHCYLSRKA